LPWKSLATLGAHLPSCVDPAQGMGQHIEPPGVIAEDRQIGGDAPLDDGTKQGAFSHQAKMPRIGNALLRQDRLAGGLIRPAQKP